MAIGNVPGGIIMKTDFQKPVKNLTRVLKSQIRDK